MRRASANFFLKAASSQKGCPESDVSWRSESGCHRDQREEAEEMLRRVLLRMNKLGRQRMGGI